MPPTPPPLSVMAVPGPGVEPVADLVNAMISDGRMARGLAAIADGVARWPEDGITDGHAISLGILADMEAAGTPGWTLRRGVTPTGSRHSWIERDAVALDGGVVVEGPGEGEGTAVILVMPAEAFREARGLRETGLDSGDESLSV
ncbi:MAG: hypothetical protein OEZ65_14650 [Gemmatimonadota bacterium]|nr:hypothetical protein [Gemmatimonadota bacterium]